MKLFIDMDQVLTDFAQAVSFLGPDATQGLPDSASEGQKQIMYDAIEKAKESFWSDMPWLESGKQLWEMIKTYHPVLLSSPGEFRYAKAGKQVWVARELPGVSLFLSDEKWRYADSESLLIDDSSKNVDAWREQGGLAILHKDVATTEKELLELLWKKPYLTL